MRKGPLLLLFFVGLTFGQYVPCRTGFNSFVVTVPNGTFGCSSYEDASVVEWDVRSDLLIDFVFALFATEACCDKDRKSTRLNSSHRNTSRMPSSA